MQLVYLYKPTEGPESVPCVRSYFFYNVKSPIMGAGKLLYKFTLYCQHMSAESCWAAVIVLHICRLMALPGEPPQLEEKVLWTRYQIVTTITGWNSFWKQYMCRSEPRAHNQLKPNHLHVYLPFANNATVTSRVMFISSMAPSSNIYNKIMEI